MGMYDYIGNSGDQVKCFYVPSIYLKHDDEAMDNRVVFSSSGGQLKGYIQVPYQTPYYNYGKDFIIVDEGNFDERPFVHLICNGEYKETVYIKDLTTEFSWIYENVIDCYGQFIKAHSIKDIKDFLYEREKAFGEFKYLEDMYLTKAGMSVKLPSPDEFKKMAETEASDYFKRRDSARKRAHRETIERWANKWYDYEKESDISIIGMIFYEYCLYAQDVALKMQGQEISHVHRRRHEYEWYYIIPSALTLLREEGYHNPIDAYISWCITCKNESMLQENNITLLRTIFDEYSKPVPQAVADDWYKLFEEKRK